MTCDDCLYVTARLFTEGRKDRCEPCHRSHARRTVAFCAFGLLVAAAALAYAAR